MPTDSNTSTRLFRGVYAEVFSALPMNGGTYSSLLNVASKRWAALAAVLSTLSYTATAVTSAASAADYLQYGFPLFPAVPTCVFVLCFFAVLTLFGLKDSARAATVLFLCHLACMGVLLFASFSYCVLDGFSTLQKSWESETPLAIPYSSVLTCLFYGYSSALLGVTGFETSANYIEEQKPNVFPKTLRNMWAIITILNPTLCLLAMGVVPIEELVTHGNYSLAFVAERAVGAWFRNLVVLDSFLVLSGAVLTAYVGIVGMHRRLALDRVVPNFFLDTNTFRKTNHFIILTFCALTVSLRLAVRRVETLGGVYAIAFLSVMMLFCISNVLLKWRRASLRRSPVVHPAVPIIGGLAVFAGFIGNLSHDAANAKFFGIYFLGFSALVLGTKVRVMLLRVIVGFLPPSSFAARAIRGTISDIENCPMVFFVSDSESSSLDYLNKAVKYVEENEDTHTLKIVHCFGKKGKEGEEGLHVRGGECGTEPLSIISSFASSTPSTESVCGSKLRLEKNNPLAVDTINRCPLPSCSKNAARNYYSPSNTVTTYSSAPIRNGIPASQSVSSLPAPEMGITMDERTLEKIEYECALLDHMFPALSIELVLVDAPFCPATVDAVSKEMGVNKNHMFIGCPSETFPFAMKDFGGIRIVL